MVWMDYHLHTADSVDSTVDMLALCRRAVEIDCREICFTEHYDNDPYDCGYHYYDDARYERRLAAARREFDGRLVIRKGLEFDFQSRYAGELAGFLARHKFDFILGSVHNVFGWMVRMAMERGYPAEEVYRAYFSEMRALVAHGGCNCLGHCDYVRKTCDDLLGDYRYPGYEEEMADLLSRAVAAGVGLEVNSRVYPRQPLAPNVEVMRMYHRAGGRIVTLGSDAHRIEDFGAGRREACRLLRDAGFTEYMSFTAGRPTPRPLPEV